MIKSILAAGFLTLAIAAPAFAAEDMICDDATMTKWKTDIDTMTDKTTQTSSMKSYDEAMAYMKAKDMDNCKKVLGATQSTKGNDAQGSSTTGTTGTTN